MYPPGQDPVLTAFAFIGALAIAIVITWAVTRLADFGMSVSKRLTEVERRLDDFERDEGPTQDPEANMHQPSTNTPRGTLKHE